MIDILDGDGNSAVRPWLDEQLASRRREVAPDAWEEELSHWLLVALVEFAKQTEDDWEVVADAFLAIDPFDVASLPDALAVDLGADDEIGDVCDSIRCSPAGERLLDLIGTAAPHIWALVAVWDFSRRPPDEQARAILDHAEALLAFYQRQLVGVDREYLSGEHRKLLEDGIARGACGLRLHSQLRRGKITSEQFMDGAGEILEGGPA